MFSSIIHSDEIKAHIAGDLDASTGARDVVVTNPDQEKGQKEDTLKVRKCIKDCKKPVPFAGNPFPIHDVKSDLYRSDCTNSACHKDILKESTKNASILSFHVLKILDPGIVGIGIIPGEQIDEKCVYCHRDTDLIEHSAGNIRRNVDVEICHSCHTNGLIGKVFYKYELLH